MNIFIARLCCIYATAIVKAGDWCRSLAKLALLNII
jgi:hypothetical protein